MTKIWQPKILAAMSLSILAFGTPASAAVVSYRLTGELAVDFFSTQVFGSPLTRPFIAEFSFDESMTQSIAPFTNFNSDGIVFSTPAILIPRASVTHLQTNVGGFSAENLISSSTFGGSDYAILGQFVGGEISNVYFNLSSELGNVQVGTLECLATCQYLPVGIATSVDGGGELSNLRLEQLAVAAVPEPATWSMMIAGFGMVGGAMRYRRRSTKVAFATA